MGAPATGAGAPATGQSRQELAIPTNTAGGIIGKGGSMIRDLRQQSRTFISIADPDPANPDERIVTIQGSSEGINHAIILIRQLVEQYQPHQAHPHA